MRSNRNSSILVEGWLVASTSALNLPATDVILPRITPYLLIVVYTSRTHLFLT
jgi:hypothetical protein